MLSLTSACLGLQSHGWPQRVTVQWRRAERPGAALHRRIGAVFEQWLPKRTTDSCASSVLRLGWTALQHQPNTDSKTHMATPGSAGEGAAAASDRTPTEDGPYNLRRLRLRLRVTISALAPAPAPRKCCAGDSGSGTRLLCSSNT